MLDVHGCLVDLVTDGVDVFEVLGVHVLLGRLLNPWWAGGTEQQRLRLVI